MAWQLAKLFWTKSDILKKKNERKKAKKRITFLFFSPQPSDVFICSRGQYLKTGLDDCPILQQH